MAKWKENIPFFSFSAFVIPLIIMIQGGK